MINPTLSRRVAKISLAPQVIQMTLEDRFAFNHALGSASGFEDLPERWKEFIKAAERSVREGIIFRYGAEE